MVDKRNLTDTDHSLILISRCFESELKLQVTENVRGEKSNPYIIFNINYVANDIYSYNIDSDCENFKLNEFIIAQSLSCS